MDDRVQAKFGGNFELLLENFRLPFFVMYILGGWWGETADEPGASLVQTPARGDTRPTKIPPRNPPIRFRKNVPDCWIALELVEGKNRQVRRMTAAIGHPTLRLLRVWIGNFRLGGLPPDECKSVFGHGLGAGS